MVALRSSKIRSSPVSRTVQTKNVAMMGAVGHAVIARLVTRVMEAGNVVLRVSRIVEIKSVAPMDVAAPVGTVPLARAVPMGNVHLRVQVALSIVRGANVVQMVVVMSVARARLKPCV